MSDVRDGFPDVTQWSDSDLSKYVRKALTESYGGRIDYDPVYNDLYSLDFVINRVESIHALVNLGVRTTFSTEDYARQEAFLEAAKKGVVHKSIYAEFNRRNIDKGALVVAYAAFLAFLFDNRYRDLRAIGLRIFEDCTYHFFSLEENIRRLRRERHEEANDYDRQVNGDIIAYFTDKGFGFIEDENAQKFFFHIANVVDEDLRIQLPSYNQGDTIPVTFYYGGSDGKKYPKAVNVTLVTSSRSHSDFGPLPGDPTDKLY